MLLPIFEAAMDKGGSAMLSLAISRASLRRSEHADRHPSSWKPDDDFGSIGSAGT